MVSFDRGQLILWCHGPKLDIVVNKEVEQVLTAAEDFRWWRARWQAVVECSARASPEGKIEEVGMPTCCKVGPHHLTWKVRIIRAAVSKQEILVVADRLADTETQQGRMVIMDIGISRIQASLPAMLDDDVIVACARIKGRGLLAGGNQTTWMRWVIMYIADKMCYPSPAATLIRYFVDDVMEFGGLSEHLVNVGVLNTHQTQILKGCIRGGFTALQAEPINVVLLSVEALLEITSCS